jgi:ribosomal protein S18 acetylase RimI-like enzyme
MHGLRRVPRILPGAWRIGAIRYVTREAGSLTRITLRPAIAEDFDYCANLYFAGIEWILEELKLDRAAQVAGFRLRWEATEVRIIQFNGADIGWLQSRVEDDTLFLAQIFVDAAFQRRGIGTQVMKRLIAEAAHARWAITLGVVKTNPALRLYRRLGFRITHDDDRKFYMRREAITVSSI